MAFISYPAVSPTLRPVSLLTYMQYNIFILYHKGILPEKIYFCGTYWPYCLRFDLFGDKLTGTKYYFNMALNLI